MSKINIGGDPLDKNYRYKRDQIKLEKIARNGGLIKIANIHTICKQMKVGFEFVDIFYGELKRRGIAMFGKEYFKGQLTVELAENILNKWIIANLLCPQCKLPEWNGESCRACGYVKATKNTKTVTEQPVEQTCPHVGTMVVLVKKLYKLARNDRAQYNSIMRAIESFWNIPMCIELQTSGHVEDSQWITRPIKPERCQELCTKWTCAVLKAFPELNSK